MEHEKDQRGNVKVSYTVELLFSSSLEIIKKKKKLIKNIFLVLTGSERIVLMSFPYPSMDSCLFFF